MGQVTQRRVGVICPITPGGAGQAILEKPRSKCEGQQAMRAMHEHQRIRHTHWKYVLDRTGSYKRSQVKMQIALDRTRRNPMTPQHPSRSLKFLEPATSAAAATLKVKKRTRSLLNHINLPQEQSCRMNCPGVGCQNEMYEKECALSYQIVIWGFLK